MHKTILFVIDNLDMGGAEKHISQLLPFLKENKISPAVYTLTHKGVQSELLESKGIFVYEPENIKRFRKLPLFFRKPLIAIASAITLWRIMKNTKTEIVHFFLPRAYIIGGLCSLFTSVPKRVMSRRSLSVYSNHRPFVRFIERFLHKKMDALIGNSHAVVKQLEKECCSHNKIRLIYNGVILDRFNIDTKKRTIREDLQISDNHIIVTMVANIIPYKGHKDLISAISMIDRDIPYDYIFLFVGRDDGTGVELKKLASQLGVADKIKWLGERNDVPDILRASDMGLLCSHQEGFSNSILEKMAAELPMVVTDVGGNSEAVVNRVCGLVVPAHKPAALSRALVELIVDEKNRIIMGKAARNRVEEKFSQKISVRNYIDLYESL